MLRQVDKSQTHLIQKVTTSKGDLIRYQVVPANKIGNWAAVTEFQTLTEARAEIGLIEPADVSRQQRTLAEMRQAKAEKAKATSEACRAKKSKTNKKAA